jgi:integrase
VIPWVFHNNGRPIRDFYKAWRAAVKAAGLGALISHDMRRTAVRNLERANVSRSVSMKLTGHKTESVYRRYAIVASSDLKEAGLKLNALHAADQAKPAKVVPLHASLSAAMAGSRA